MVGEGVVAGELVDGGVGLVCEPDRGDGPNVFFERSERVPVVQRCRIVSGPVSEPFLGEMSEGSPSGVSKALTGREHVFRKNPSKRSIEGGHVL